jgi:hypothetical protein
LLIDKKYLTVKFNFEFVYFCLDEYFDFHNAQPYITSGDDPDFHCSKALRIHPIT